MSDLSHALWLVEDDRAYRETLAAVFEHAGYTCTGLFDAVEAAVAARQAGAPAPDALLIDVNLPGVDGLHGLRLLRPLLPRTVFLVVTIHDEPSYIAQALEAGASGYVVKSAPLDDLLRSVEEALNGGMLLPPPVARLVQARFQQVSPKATYGLTAREHEVLALMADGLVQREIATRLFVSTATVNTHVQHIYEKLHVSSASGAVGKAFREGLL